MHSPSASLIESARADVFGFHELLLTKRREWTFAPWAEQPYIYAYYIARDQYGRQIAGDAWIEYINNYDRFLAHVSEWIV